MASSQERRAQSIPAKPGPTPSSRNLPQSRNSTRSLRKATSFTHQNVPGNDSVNEACREQDGNIGLPAFFQSNDKKRRSGISTTRDETHRTRSGARITNQRHEKNVVASNTRARSVMSNRGTRHMNKSTGTLARNQAADRDIGRPQSRGRTRRRTPATFQEVTTRPTHVATSPQAKLPNDANISRTRSIRDRERPRVTSETGTRRSGRQRTNPYIEKQKQPRPIRYVAKGGFLPKKTIDLEEFRFPVLGSQSDATWSPGDGFSEDEVSPSFLFYVTGHKKRRHPAPPIEIGMLKTEPLGGHVSSIRSLKASRGNGQGSFIPRLRLLRGAAKDVWPTYDEFMDTNLSIQSPQPIIDKNIEAVSESFVVYNSTETSLQEPRPTLKYVPRRGRGPLEFQIPSSSVEPEVRSTFTPAMLRMEALRMSSPLRETDTESRIDADEEMTEHSVIHETPPCGDLSSEEDDSSSGDSDESIRSYWDKHGNHFFADDVRAMKRQKRHASEDEPGECVYSFEDDDEVNVILPVNADDSDEMEESDGEQ